MEDGGVVGNGGCASSNVGVEVPIVGLDSSSSAVFLSSASLSFHVLSFTTCGVEDGDCSTAGVEGSPTSREVQDASGGGVGGKGRDI